MTWLTFAHPAPSCLVTLIQLHDLVPLYTAAPSLQTSTFVLPPSYSMSRDLPQVPVQCIIAVKFKDGPRKKAMVFEYIGGKTWHIISWAEV